MLTATCARRASLMAEFCFAADVVPRRIADIRTSNFIAGSHTANLHAEFKCAASRLEVNTVNAVINAPEAVSLHQQLSNFVAAGSTEVTQSSSATNIW